MRRGSKMCSLGPPAYVRTNVSETSTVPIALSMTMHPDGPEITFLAGAPAAAPGEPRPWPYSNGPFLIVPFE